MVGEIMGEFFECKIKETKINESRVDKANCKLHLALTPAKLKNFVKKIEKMFEDVVFLPLFSFLFFPTTFVLNVLNVTYIF